VFQQFPRLPPELEDTECYPIMVNSHVRQGV
jgi:hypothetical protein